MKKKFCNISGLLLGSFKVFLSIFTKDVVIFSHILPTDFLNLQLPINQK